MQRSTEHNNKSKTIRRMGILSIFRKSKNRFCTKAVAGRPRSFRRLTVESVESRSMLTNLAIAIQGTAEISNLAMASGGEVPVARASLDITVGSNTYHSQTGP